MGSPRPIRGFPPAKLASARRAISWKIVHFAYLPLPSPKERGGLGMMARARFGEAPMIHVADFNGMAIQAPSTRARPDFFGPAAIADGGAWAMARTASPIGWINAHGSVMMANSAGIGARAYWMAPRPLAIGVSSSQRGPSPIPARPGLAPLPAGAAPRGCSSEWSARIPHAMNGKWGWSMAHGGFAHGTRPLRWRLVRR